MFWGHRFLPSLRKGLPRSDADHSGLRFLGGPRQPGAASETYICFDENRGGAVVLFHRNRPTEFINSSLEQFAAYLSLHGNLLVQAAQLSMPIRLQLATEPASDPLVNAYQSTVTAILDQTEQEMRRLDPVIWDGLTYSRAERYGEGGMERYWPSIFVRYGEYSIWPAKEIFRQWAGMEE